jgi:hypothetical protein
VQAHQHHNQHQLEGEIMSDQTGIGVKPSGRGIRDPLTNAQNNGRVVNPPRFPVFGGFSSATKAFFRNALHIVKPGNGTK